jgi:hypothetical protein
VNDDLEANWRKIAITLKTLGGGILSVPDCNTYWDAAVDSAPESGHNLELVRI